MNDLNNLTKAFILIGFLLGLPDTARAQLFFQPNPVQFTIGGPGGTAGPTSVGVTSGSGFSSLVITSINTASGGNWLCAVTSGTSAINVYIGNGPCAVATSTAQLATNQTYTGTINVQSSSGTQFGTINVNLGVGNTGGGSGGIAAFPSSLSFSSTQGGLPNSQTVQVTQNGSPQTITGFNFNPTSGGVSFINTSVNGAVATLSVNNTNLSNGVYTGTETLFTQSGSVAVPVTLTIGATSSNIVASPNPVNFNIAVGGTAPTQNVSLTLNGFPVNTSNAPTTTTNTGQPWLLANASPVAGTIIVGINGSQLGPGTYSGTVTAVTDQGTASFQVNLTVGSGGAAGLVATPSSVFFNAVVGGQAGSQNVSVTVNGIPTSITGFSFTPTSGGGSFVSTSINGSVATLSVNNTNLSNGVYTGTETLFTPNGSVTVPVTLTIGSGGSNIVSTPNPVNFTILTGGSAPAQTVTVLSNGASTNVTGVSATTTTGQAWLLPSVSPSLGLVDVRINGAFLAAGSYSGTVTVNTLQGTGSFQVNLTVTASGGSGVVASPSAVSFNAFFGGQAGSQNVSVTVNGVQTSITGFSFLPTSGGSFINTSINGSVATLSVNNTNLANGVYTGTETLFTSSGSVSVPVTLTIGSGGSSNIVANPNPVNFTIATGGSAPSQNVLLTLNGFPVNTNNPPTTTTTTGQPWLLATASPVGGTIIVSINGSQLSPGTYSGTVTAVTEQGTASFQVNLTVGTGGSTGGLVATPGSVSFNTVFGGQANSQNVSVTLNGSPITITGFSFTPASGVSFINTSTNGSVATLTLNGANLTNGVYTGTETLFTPSGSVTVPVTLTVGSVGGSILVSTPNPVIFSIPTGGSAPAQTVTVLANGTSTNVTGVSATTTTGQAWLQPSVSPSLGLVDVRVNGSFLAPGTYTGTVTVNTLQGTGSFQVNLTVGGTSGGLSNSGSMAHLAFAGFWKTIITLMNTGTTVSQARLNFFDDNGNALPVSLTFPQISPFPQSPVSSLDRTISPGAILTMEITGPDFQTVQTGWAQLQTGGNITGFAVFRQSVGNSQHEAVVPLENRNAGTYVLAFDNTSGFVTGVAVANTAAQSAFIQVIIRDDNGTVLQSTSIPLAALGHTSFNLTDRFPVTGQRRGLVEFQTPPGGGISLLGLRFNPAGTFSTVPLAVK